MTVDPNPIEKTHRRPNYAIAYIVHERVLASARHRFLGRPRRRFVPAGIFHSIEVSTREISDPWTEAEVADLARRETTRQLNTLDRDAKIVAEIGFMHLATV